MRPTCIIHTTKSSSGTLNTSPQRHQIAVRSWQIQVICCMQQFKNYFSNFNRSLHIAFVSHDTYHKPYYMSCSDFCNIFCFFNDHIFILYDITIFKQTTIWVLTALILAHVVQYISMYELLNVQISWEQWLLPTEAAQFV